MEMASYKKRVQNGHIILLSLHRALTNLQILNLWDILNALVMSSGWIGHIYNKSQMPFPVMLVL